MEKTKFSGWRVLIGCFLCMFLIQGGLQTFAIYMPQVAADTGWSVAMVGIVSTFAAGSGFLANLLLSRMLKVVNARLLLCIGIVFFTLHQIVYTLANNLFVLWLGGFVGGFAIGWGTAAPCSVIITNWFIKNRSRYIAATVAGSMLGSVLLNPVAAKLIDVFGWRTAWRIEGPVVGALALLAVLLLVRVRPEDVGQKAYGEEEAPETGAPVRTGVDAATARKSLSYVLLAVGIFLLGLSTNAENYMPAFWQSRGLSSLHSSYVMSVYALVAAVGSLVMSKVNDRLGGKGYVLLISVLFVLPLLIMTYTGVCSSIALLSVCCIPFALGGKKSSTMTPSLVVAEAFGSLHYASIIGLFAGMLQLGIAVSSIVISQLLPLGYEPVFTILAVLNVAGMLCMVIALACKPHKG